MQRHPHITDQVMKLSANIARVIYRSLWSKNYDTIFFNEWKSQPSIAHEIVRSSLKQRTKFEEIHILNLKFTTKL